MCGPIARGPMFIPGWAYRTAVEWDRCRYQLVLVIHGSYTDSHDDDQQLNV